ncbi:MAG TPA: Ig-like domain-containing protein [Candidatus Cloacimonadota bacterium]|nr:Ig-like domain-containing protein [Candidatus Cloacimonadota bacterium]HPT71340.1 Ig-like domain-containing protein [Candidatus Cloacimonadota bacterium]
MKKWAFILVFSILIACMTAMEFTGNPKNWKFEDFVGADSIGDTNGQTGDISSLFVRKEAGILNLRLTFDDMCVRKHNRFVNDNYSDRYLILSVKAVNTKNRDIEIIQEVSLTDKVFRNSAYSLVRTPENNMLEMSFPFLSPTKADEMDYTITVKDATGKIIDELQKSGGTRDGGGNCAFVHHGNQGLTYTDVFYGQYPQDTSGFDEILQVHDATNVPGNFHLSGTLMPAAQWHNPDFNTWLKTMASQGKACMLTSALGQHIMPFVNDNMNNWAVHTESDMVRYLYNYDPKVAWVPERVWLDPNRYPNNGVIDWIGDNWRQHGVEAVILDDWPHCSGYSNSKIHWMNNGMGINLRVIPINGDFVGKMMYDASGAKNMIWNTGMYGLTVYGTDWEVASEMNQHNNTFFLDNYENVVWWCHDNYPAVQGWKLDTALSNANFNGQGIEITPGNYGLLGGTGGYGGSNNSWYPDWAATQSHSDFHSPKWNYGYIWNDAYNNLMTAPNNSLSQIGWYILMINLHETGWHDAGVSDWIHRYSSHIKNANVYAEAARWAAGQYTTTTAAYFNDIDHDGGSELVMHNDKVFAVFEGIGGKANWLFYKDGYGNAYSMVGSDMAYWAETDGDYNETSSCNHFAALSDVSPNMQGSIYNISIQQSSGTVVQATLDQVGVKKVIKLETGKNYLDCSYNFFGSTGYIKSGWSPDILDILWSGKGHLQRLYGSSASYAGYRNSTSGASVAYILGSAGGSHQGQFEGTLVEGDQISGNGIFAFRLYAGYTSSPSGTQVSELNTLASQTVDLIGPSVSSASIIGTRKIQVIFSEVLDQTSAETISNYALGSSYHVTSAKLYFGKKVVLTVDSNITAGSTVTVQVNGVKDISGNITDTDYNTATASWVNIPHIVGTMNSWTPSNHTYDLVLQDNGVWKVAIALGVGTHEYKVSESDSWGNDWPTNNQSITLTTAQTVTFYANCGLNIGAKSGDEYVTHYAPQVAGDFLSELGGTDWSTSDSHGVMNDSDNDGIWRLQVLVPSGSYQYKIALNKTWDQSTSGVNFAFTSDGTHETIFYYNMATNSTYSSSTGVFSPPTNLSAQIITSGIRLSWNAPQSRAISSYNIYRNNALLTNTSNLSYDDLTVANGHRYAYAVSTVYTSPSGTSAVTDSVIVSYFVPTELTAVQFMPSTMSSYTNFVNGGEIASHDNLRLEVKLTPNDSLNISTHSALLHYSLNNTTWNTRFLAYDHNAGGSSYWRLALNNGVDFNPNDTLRFYITATDYNGPTLTDNNGGSNYSVHIHQIGIEQQVAVTFRVNMSYVSPADSVFVAGDFTNWATNKVQMTDPDHDLIYTVTINFPIDSIYDHQYKFINGTTWEFVGLDNRAFTVDDSNPTQLLDMAYFNMNATSELQSVQFLQDSQSEFTNFDNGVSMPGNSYLYFEVRLSPADSLDNSHHRATLVYKKNSGDWQESDFAWDNNYQGNSYWRYTMRNGTDIVAGDNITFYVTATDYNGPVLIDNNNGSNYHVSLRSATLSQQVTVNFSVDMRFVAHTDSIYLAGDFTDWGTNRIRMYDANLDGIYSASYTFPAGADYTRQYKYMNGQEWEFYYGIQRIFLVDDTYTTQTLPVDFFNNVMPTDLVGIQFMPQSSSVYTNFNPGESVANGSNLLFEVQLTPPDFLANSYYGANLRYRVNNGSWITKAFAWDNNYENYAYWRTALTNGEDINNGDYVDFYVDATDYNGPVLVDNNSGQYYRVNVGDVINLQTPLSFGISLTETSILLNWDDVPMAHSYKVYQADSPDGSFSLLATTTSSEYSISLGSAPMLKFYRVVASTEVLPVKK